MNVESKQITGKVAIILNTRELAINIGKKDGVKVDMIFKILSPNSITIKDPDTQKIIVSIKREKTRVKAIEVNDDYTICRTYRTKTIEGFNPLATMADLISGPRTITESLKAEDSERPTPLSEEESYVKIGDIVESIYDVDADSDEF